MALNTDRLKSLGDTIPGLYEKSGPAGVASVGVQKQITVPVGAPLLVDGVTYKGIVFVAPCDGCFIKELWLSAPVLIAGGTSTLAIDNYDASAHAARNALSTTNVDPAVTPAVALEGSVLTLTTTLANRTMDEGDVLNFVLVCGTMTTDGQGYALTATVIVPDIQ